MQNNWTLRYGLASHQGGERGIRNWGKLFRYFSFILNTNLWRCERELVEELVMEGGRVGPALPRIASTRFAANNPVCLFWRCLASCKTSNLLEKTLLWDTTWTLCRLVSLVSWLMKCSLIFVMVLSDKSERGKRVEYIILLLGNLVETSVTKAEISETKSPE